MNKYFPNWRTFEDGVNKLEYGIGVDGSTFSILGAKLFTIKIGKTVLKAQLSIPEKSNELILGLDLLKNFQMKINFTKPIEFLCKNSFIPSAYVTNKQNCIL